MSTRRVTHLALAVAAVGAGVLGGEARANPEAEAAFAHGRDALGEGKYVEACAAFDEAQHLDPQPTTQFNIALCSEQLGKLATALAIYKDLAAHDDNPARRAKHPEKVAELEQRVARLTVVVKPSPPGLQIAIDNALVAGIANLPIDLGTSTVTVTAPGYTTATSPVTAKDEKQRVVLNILLAADTTSPPPPPPLPPAHHAVSMQKAVAGGMVIAGGGSLVASLVTGWLAHGKYADAKDVCGGTICDAPADLARANGLVDQARTRGDLSTAFAIAGAVVAAGGVVLWLTAPSPERASVAVTPTLGGVTVLGRF